MTQIRNDFANSGSYSFDVNKIEVTSFDENLHSIDFDGIDQFISGSSLSTQSAMTLEFWVKPEEYSGSIISQWTTGSQASFGDSGWNVYWSNDSLVWATHPVGIASPNYLEIPKSNISQSEWTHIACTMTTAKKTMILNGNQFIEESGGWNTLPDSWSLQLATMSGNNPIEPIVEGYFKGKLDEIRIWNSALTASVVKESMSVTIENPDEVSGLLAYYDAEGSSSILIDRTLNEKNMTLYNDPTRSFDVPFTSQSVAMLIESSSVESSIYENSESFNSRANLGGYPYLQVPNHPSHSGMSGLTCQFWGKRKGGYAGEWWTPMQNISAMPAIYTYQANNLTVGGTAAGWISANFGSDPFSDNNWHMFQMRYTSSEGKIQARIDSGSWHDSAASSGPVATSNQGIVLFAWSASNDPGYRHWSGSIDQFALFNEWKDDVWLNENISSSIQEFISDDSAQLLLDFELGQTNGDEIYDKSQNALTCSISNTSTMYTSSDVPFTSSIISEGINIYPATASIYKTSGDSIINNATFIDFAIQTGSFNASASFGFQLSNNGTDWKHWNGSSWASASSNETNTENEININISVYTASNELFVNSFLKTSYSGSGAELDWIEINYSSPIPVNSFTNLRMVRIS